MNKLQICQKILEEADRDPETLQSVQDVNGLDDQHRNIVRWVDREYDRIQRSAKFWKFHHQSGLFLTTSSDGTTDYTVPNVREIHAWTIKAKVQGTTAEWPLHLYTYEEWRKKFLIGRMAPGTPVMITRVPNGDFRLYPAPLKVFEIYADWSRTFHRMITDTDSPLWNSDDYDEYLIWRVLENYVSEYDVPELAARVAKNLPHAKVIFDQELLPEWEDFQGLI